MASTSSPPPAKPEPPTTVEAFAAQNLARRINVVADRLDDLAATVRRRAAEVGKTGEPGRPYYANIVRDVVHEVHVTLMNAGLGSLSTDAAEADAARVRGE